MLRAEIRAGNAEIVSRKMHSIDKKTHRPIFTVSSLASDHSRTRLYLDAKSKNIDLYKMPSDTSDEYQVTLCTSASQLRSACDVRVQVFVNEQGFALSDEIDQYDPHAAHFLLIHRSEPTKAIGTLRLLPYPLPIPKPDPAGAEPHASSSYPLGGSRSESGIASDFISAVWTHIPHPTSSARDPAQTQAEEQQTEAELTDKGGAKLGRLAVLKEARGKGLGDLLVRRAEAWLIDILSSGKASKQGAFGPGQTLHSEAHDANEEQSKRLQSIIIKLSSQIYAIDFYKK